MWILFCRRQEEIPAFAGKTDGEAVREDRWRKSRFFMMSAHPSLSLEYWGMNLQIVFPGNVPGGQHLALLYDTRCFSTLVELSSLGKCLVRMATKVGSPFPAGKKD